MKAAMSSTKYVIYGNFKINGYLDKPDLIGAFFGQTEGLIGEELEFSTLQKTGKLGRIDINLKKSNSKTQGNFKIPTALDKAQVSLVAAALETITKIGHCSGSITIEKIKDEREDKRREIKIRAQELLEMLKEELPESNEMLDEIDNEIKLKSIKDYGNNVFGPYNISNQDEIILVEGRADVINLIKFGINNVLSFDGSNMPSNPLKKLIKGKKTIAFLDDDNSGRRELEVLKDKFKVTFYTFAPDGKEVEELSIKDINRALKNKKEVVYSNGTIIDKIKHVLIKKGKVLVEPSKKYLKKIKEEEKEDKKNTLISLNEVRKDEKNNIDKKERNKNTYSKKQTKVNPNPNVNVVKKHNPHNLPQSKYEKKEDLKPQKNKTKINENRFKNIQISKLNEKEIKKVKEVIEDIKNKSEFVILDSNLKEIKRDNIENLQIYLDLNNPKILIINAICESSVLKKVNDMKISNIVARKKTNFNNVNSSLRNRINVQLFDELNK